MTKKGIQLRSQNNYKGRDGLSYELDHRNGKETKVTGAGRFAPSKAAIEIGEMKGGNYD